MGDRPAKLNEKKSDRELEWKIRSYLLEEQHENFLAAKMRNPSGHQGENERGKKVNNNRYDISSIKRLTRTFLKVSRCGCAKLEQRQRNVQKKVCGTCKVVFLLIRPIVVFSPFSLPSPLSKT